MKTEKQILTSLDGVEILDTWKIDLYELNEEINTLRRKLAKAKRERKFQPTLILVTPITNEWMIANQYQICDGFIRVESRRPATEEEIQKFSGKED